MNSQTIDDLRDFTGKVNDFKFYNLPFDSDVVQNNFLGNKFIFESMAVSASMELKGAIKYVLKYYQDTPNFYNLAVSVSRKYMPEIDIKKLLNWKNLNNERIYFNPCFFWWF